MKYPVHLEICGLFSPIWSGTWESTILFHWFRLQRIKQIFSLEIYLNQIFRMEKILQQICGFFHTLPEPIRRISRSFKSVIHSPLAAIWKLSPHHCWMLPWFSIMQFLALPEILFPLMGILGEGGQPLFIQLSVHSESTCILHRLAEGSGGNSFRSDDIMLFDKWWINYFLFFIWMNLRKNHCPTHFK